MHNAALASLSLDWRYLAFDVAPERLRQALEGCRAMHFVGVNLTVPHKLIAVPFMDELDETAKEWGAVNTVAFEGQEGEGGDWRPLRDFEGGMPAHVRLRGYNTDADAVIRSIREDLICDPAGAQVMVLGAGGAGRVAALKLASCGVDELFLVNRTQSRAAEVADEVIRRFPKVRVRVGYPPGRVDLALNATSLGLRVEDGLPYDAARWSPDRATFAYDMVYRPAQTPFLGQAKSAGCRVANGLGMLLYQGARALEIWTGRPAPVALMRQALVQHIYGDRIEKGGL